MEKHEGIPRKLLCEESGSAAVVTAVILSVLMVFSALVVDWGAFFAKAGVLQNALDSAALAAVLELPADNTGTAEWAAATAEAVTYADLNGISVTSADITPIYRDNDTGKPIIGLRVTQSATVEYYFAKVIGIDTGTVTRAASASLESVSGVKGAIPLCVPAASLRYALDNGTVTNLIIKCSTDTGFLGIDATGTQGWFGALDYEGSSGASTYADLLAIGYDGTLSVGQLVQVENGNMSGPTLDGFTRRYSQCTDGCTAENYTPDCPRLCFIPVVEVVGSKEVKIVSFAAFFLESCGGSGNNSYITATYIAPYVVSDPGSGESGQDFGMYAAKLTG